MDREKNGKYSKSQKTIGNAALKRTGILAMLVLMAANSRWGQETEKGICKAAGERCYAFEEKENPEKIYEDAWYDSGIEKNEYTVHVQFNENTGYAMVIADQADLLTEEEEGLLLQKMNPLSPYGSVGFYALDNSPDSTDELAEALYHEDLMRRCTLGDDSGTLFLIDMENRQIYIFSDGSLYKTIRKGNAYTITDNVYKLAKDGEYFSCASKVYEQELTLLKGGAVPQPMKWLANAFLSLVLSFFLVYLGIFKMSMTAEPEEKKLLHGMYYGQKSKLKEKKLTKTTTKTK